MVVLLAIVGLAPGCGNGEGNLEDAPVQRGTDGTRLRGEPNVGAADSPKGLARGAEADLPPPPPPPRAAVARRRGEQVIIDYRFGPLPESKERRPYQIVTSVDPVGGRYSPITVRRRIRGRSGRVVQPLGLDKPPFDVRVSAEAKTGMRSRTLSVPLR